jgi:hypothetical protein
MPLYMGVKKTAFFKRKARPISDNGTYVAPSAVGAKIRACFSGDGE